MTRPERRIRWGLWRGKSRVEINGQPADVFLQKYKEQGIVLETVIEELITVDNNGELKSVSINEIPLSRQSLTELFSFFVMCIIFWIIGFYVYLKKPENTAALLFCICSLIFGLALSSNMAGERVNVTAIHLSVISSVIGPYLLLHFFVVLPEERAWLRNRKALYLIYLPALITLILHPLIGFADGQPLQEFRSFRLLAVWCSICGGGGEWLFITMSELFH